MEGRKKTDGTKKGWVRSTYLFAQIGKWECGSLCVFATNIGPEAAERVRRRRKKGAIFFKEKNRGFGSAVPVPSANPQKVAKGIKIWRKNWKKKGNK